ncbi:adiponectin receptor protein 1 [Tricladium varicosporioides]|nr:adiponectin receptor protein 1 [Hymenoscyphus varicosporioides]
MASDLNLQKSATQLGADRQPKLQSGHSLLLQWNELPSWQQDNEFIISGYRPASESFRKSLNSLQHIHNETVNIYSHLLGAVLFAALPVYVYEKVRSQHTTAQAGDIVGFAVFFFGATVCFFLSASFHIVSNHSENVAAHWNQLDYLGIITLIWGSIVPSIYYGFYCDPNLQKMYWAVVSVLAVVCTMATLTPKFRRPTFRVYRTAMYASLGVLAMVFITHGAIIHGWQTQNHRMGLTYMLITAMLNLLGAVVYTTRIPERWYRLRYDIYGGSHQAFHFIVVFASLIHMLGLLSAFGFIHSQAHSCA